MTVAVPAWVPDDQAHAYRRAHQLGQTRACLSTTAADLREAARLLEREGLPGIAACYRQQAEHAAAVARGCEQ